MADAATETKPKRWYIVHAYSNFENKVADSIREQAKQRGLGDLFDEIMVPKEKVVEVRRGRKVDAEHEGDGDADHLVGEQEEDRRQRREDEHHRGGDAGLLARRPGDLVGLVAHFPQELERAQLCHDLTAVTCLIPT